MKTHPKFADFDSRSPISGPDHLLHLSEAVTDDLDASLRPIESCETRLALSASWMGAWLGSLADPITQDAMDSWANGPIEPAANGPIEPLAISPTFLETCPAEFSPLPPIQPGLGYDVPIVPAVLVPNGPNLPHSHPTFASPDIDLQSALNQTAGGGGHSLIDQSARIGAATGIDGHGQTIAIIDSGIAYDHYAFGENGRGGGFGVGQRVVGGWDFAENDANPYDDGPSGYHGSHVAGLAAGMADTIDGDSFRGVAPGADLVSLRVFNDAGSGNLEWIEQSLQWVIQNQNSFEFPITTVNLSLGTELNDANRDYAYGLLEDELQSLYEKDILVFAAAGNGQQRLSPTADAMMYPASSSWVSAVGSIDLVGNLSGFSQRADDIFVAEGERLQSSVPEHVRGYDGYINDYTALSGTSMASPQVAAASALVRQAMQQSGIEATSGSILQRLHDTSVIHTDPSTGLHFRSLDLEAAIDFGSSGNNGSNDQATGSPEPISTVDRYDGTTGADQVELDLRWLLTGSGADAGNASGVVLRDTSGDEFTINGSDEPIIIDAGSGGDTLKIFGSTGNEQITMRPTTGANAGSSLLTFAGGTFELRGFENITLIGGGGEDRATLYDSDGNDELRSSPGTAEMTGVGFEFHLENVNRVYAYATAGGNDTAHLTDSVNGDRLVIRPQLSSLRGGDFFQAAFGFERVFAYAENGGQDSADLGDSAGDDVMSISETRSLISGAGYRASAMGFENVEANASRGGNDTVRIYVNEPGGSWHTTNAMTQWTGADGTERIARGFERSEAFENYQPVASRSYASPESINRLGIDADELWQSNDDHFRDLQNLFEDWER